MALAVAEQRRRRRHPGAHAAAEVGADARGHRGVAPVGVEAREVEPEPLGARPQVRVLQPALVGEQRVVHRPERALAARGLGGAGRRERARMRGPDGEVAERDAHRQRREPQLERGAERALVVAVHDARPRRVAGPADVIVRADGRDGRGRTGRPPDAG